MGNKEGLKTTLNRPLRLIKRRRHEYHFAKTKNRSGHGITRLAKLNYSPLLVKINISEEFLSL